ncbi:hypothetical protein LRS73_35415 (plasmid) [Methylobacterium currus]|uniref:hypothetical protein n=1 Tax=Methylobacterium currus TaxID=2051553 RepID=UPI001E299D93|nr:hypothetical protein [Methylobacterium currus]UHC20468.1 hypothetical protein LRS73_35415 [Methylobacterium currus]
MDLLDFDLTNDAEEGMDVHLRNPRTDEPLFTRDGRPVTITVAGMHSDTYREALRGAGKRMFGWPPGMFDHPMFRPQRDAADMEVLVAATLEWQGIEHAGVELDFTDEAVAAVYRRFGWIRDQVTKAIHDPKGFPATRSTWAPPAAAPKPPPQPDFSRW